MELKKGDEMIYRFLPMLLLCGCVDLVADAEKLLETDNDEVYGNYFIQLSEDGTSVVDQVQMLSDQYAFPMEDVLQVYDSVTEGMLIRVPHLLAEELVLSPMIEEIYLDEKNDYVAPIEPEEPAYDYGDNEVPVGIVRIGGPYEGSVPLDTMHVAVIDTGIDAKHMDLNVTAELDVWGYSNGQYDTSGIDTTDSAALFDLLGALDENGEFNPDLAAGDGNGHGTHVAGTIGAIADGQGVAGVAPNVSLHAIRVLGDDGSGSFSDILLGLEYVAEHPEIRVVNMSLGGPMGPGMEPIARAIEHLEENGVVVCIAAGNETQDTENVSPAGFDLGIVVSAYSVFPAAEGFEDAGFAWFSNFGDEVDIAAPGDYINSTWPGGDYLPLSGTSMATPHVAGAVAAFLANSPEEMTVDEVREALIASAEVDYAGQGGDHPEPLLDFGALMAMTSGESSAPEDTGEGSEDAEEGSEDTGDGSEEGSEDTGEGSG